MMKASRQQGNVLFLILIAVALFAALSFAVTKSSRSGPGNISREDAELQASAIIQYGTLVDTALQRMRFSTGKKDYEFDFSDVNARVSALANATCTNKDCRLYFDKGGQIPSVDLGKKMLDPSFIAIYPTRTGPFIGFKSAVVLDVGTSLPEVTLIIQGMNLDVCKALNRKLTGSSVAPVQAIGNIGSFTGTLTDYPPPTGAAYDIGSTATELKGQMAGCYIGNASIKYGNYYQVLLAR